MTDTFTCARCGGTWDKGWTDEEAMAEARANFTEAELADVAVVCDDCYKDFMPALPRLRAEVDQLAAASGIGLEAFLRREASRP